MLTWKTGEGFNVKPYYPPGRYVAARVEGLCITISTTAASRKPGNNWIIRQDFPMTDVKEANA